MNGSMRKSIYCYFSIQNRRNAMERFCEKCGTELDKATICVQSVMRIR